MATYAEGQNPARGGQPPTAEAAFVAGLRRRLRRRLNDYADRQGCGCTLGQRCRDCTERQEWGEAGPTLTIVGYDERRSGILRRCDKIPESVLGFVLPDRFRAVAVVASSVVSTSTSGYRQGVLALAVTRAGSQISFLHEGPRQLTETFEARGWLLDSCRVAVGLTTEPSGIHPLAMPLALWLDRLMVTIVGDGRTPSWREAVNLCPLPEALPGRRARGPGLGLGPGFEDFVSTRTGSVELRRRGDPAELGAALASGCVDWAELRARTAAGERLPVPVKPGWAAWMDDAMFARWCTGYFPELDELRSDLAFLGSVELYELVEATIAAAFTSYEGDHESDRW